MYNSVASQLTGIQLNCQSLNSHLFPIKNLIEIEQPTFIAFCETWLGGTKNNPNIKGYPRPHWRHRDGGQGGGLGLLFKRGVVNEEIPLIYFPNGVLEAHAARIFDKNKRPISILNIYNPNKNLTLPEIKFYIDQLDKKFIFTGDFNAHSPILDDKVNAPDIFGKSIENLILNDDLCLVNPVNCYTRTVINNDGTTTKSCLDLWFTSSCLYQGASVQILEDVCSDHLPIKITIDTAPVSAKINPPKRWIITEENLLMYKNNFPKSNLILPSSPENLAKDITDRILEAAEANIPQTSGRPRVGKSTPWWDQECATAIKKRRDAKKLVARTPNLTNLDNYIEAKNSFKRLISKKKKASFQNFVYELGPDTPIGKAHKKIRALKGYTPPPDNPLKVNNEVIIDDKEKAQALANFYESNSKTFTHKTLTDFPSKFKAATDNSPDTDYNSPITLHELLTALKSVRDSAPGCDNIPYILIKNMPPDALNDLVYVYNMALSTGTFPLIWKEGTILPIHKPSKPTDDPASFRPITLLSCLGKIFERILKMRLEFFIENNNLLSSAQTGFRREQGTIDTLLKIENEIRSCLADNFITLVVYVDLKNAFDSIWGEGLIYKLIQKGLKGNFLKTL